MTHLTVHEWGRVQLDGSGFTRPQADTLLASARAHSLGGVDGTDILCDHHGFLRARQAVGVIAGRGCSLEILPKVDPQAADEQEETVRSRLVHMLDVALGLDLSSGEASALAHQANSLLEVFIALFADRLLAEVRHGLPRQYRAYEEDLRALRGKLDVVRQFTVHAVRPDRLACRFDALDVDVPLMQVMKACVLLLDRHARSSGTKRKLAELRFLLADVSDVRRGALPWRQIRIDRGSRRWRALLELARLNVVPRCRSTAALMQRSKKRLRPRSRATSLSGTANRSKVSRKQSDTLPNALGSRALHTCFATPPAFGWRRRMFPCRKSRSSSAIPPLASRRGPMRGTAPAS